MIRTRAILLAALAAALCFCIPAFGQLTVGTLKGTIADQNAAVVPSAKITLKNDATGTTVNVQSDDEGNFTASNLLPGPYTVTVEKQGYKKTIQTGVAVAAGTVSSANVVLEPGQLSEVVTVTGSGDEALQTETSQVSGTISTRKVEELPSNGAGGGIDTLALLIPGVVANRAGGTNTNGTGLSVNGNRGRSNNFQIDGQDNNDLSVGGPALFVDFQDSVQEFQVITSNFSAQYGRNQGAIVNIVTKTGTNEFHGSGFLFHRDAYNLNSLRNTERRSGQLHPNRDLYNVYGGTVGGPIYWPSFGENTKPMFEPLKNKAFFFFGYQGIKEPSTDVVRSTATAIQANQFGRLLANYPGNTLIQAYTQYSPFAPGVGSTLNTFSTNGQTVNAAALNLGALATGCPRMIPNGSTPPTGCGTYTAYINPQTGNPYLYGGPYEIINLGTAAAPDLYQTAMIEHAYPFNYNETYWQLRGDLKFGRDSGSIRYINQNSASKNGTTATAAGWHGDLPAHSKNFGGNWTHQFGGTMVNDFRASRQQIGVEFGGGCQAKTPGCVPGPTQLDVGPANISFSFAGLTAGRTLATIGPATNLPQGRVSTVRQAADTFTWIRGSHTMTTGGEWKWLATQVPFLPNFNGTYSFNSTTRFTNNAPSGLSLAVGNPLVVFPEHDQYYFFQDDWKVRPNLTLNLGVRYEYTGQPINALHDSSVARETSSRPLFNPALPLSVRTVPTSKSDTNNWAPRFGFAWTPRFWKSLFGEDATVIRGGYSIAYDLAFYNILLNVANAAPFSASLAVPSATLVNSPGTIYALPSQPFGDVIRANAATTGLLPTGQLDPRYLSQTNVARDFRSPYSEQWSLGIQRQFGRKYVAEARYLGTHGVGLFQSVNANFFVGPLVNGFTLTKNTNGSGGFATGTTCAPTATQTCIAFPSFSQYLPAGTTAQVCTDVVGTLDNEAACNGRQFRQAGVTTRQNSSQSIYHSLQTRFNGRFLNDNLSLGATYTWSKSIDDSSEIFGFSDGASPNAQNPYCINRCERGLSSFDRPHVFTTNFIFDFPWMKQQKGVLGKILGGWQANAVYILSSGSVYTPANGIAGSYGLGSTYLTAGDRPFVTNPAADPRKVGISQIDAFFVFGIPIVNPNGFWSMNDINGRMNTVPTFTTTAVSPNDVHFVINGPGSAKIFGNPYGAGRGSLRGPKYNNLNFSLFKNIRVTEKVRLQLRGEAFNFLNHPNPGFGTGAGGAVPTNNLTNAGTTFGGFAENTDIALARRTVQVAFRITF